MNAKEVLLHPWVKNLGMTDFYRKRNKGAPAKEEDSKEKDEGPVDKAIFTDLAKFNNHCNFKLAVMQLFKKQFETMRPAHFQQLKKVFKALDKDGNGLISYEEFEAGMIQMRGVELKKEQIKEMFSELDVKSVGEIAFEELLNAAVHDYLVSSDERLYAAFRELDEDDDGKIKTEQLKASVMKLDTYGSVSLFFFLSHFAHIHNIDITRTC